MSNRLEELVAGAREDFQARRAQVTEAELRERAAARASARSLREALHAAGDARVIAEVKRASPSKGSIAPDLDPRGIAKSYVAGGAAAVSVLTEPRYFHGSLDDLDAVAGVVDVPVLRKDFIVEPYQVWEARAYGADAILLIVAALSATTIVQLMEDAAEAGVETLVEVHSADEMAVAVGCGARLVGVNARNLKTFEVDREVCAELAGLAPPDVTLVAESGIQTRADVEALQAAGYRAFLVGEILVRAPDPAAALQALRGE